MFSVKWNGRGYHPLGFAIKGGWLTVSTFATSVSACNYHKPCVRHTMNSFLLVLIVLVTSSLVAGDSVSQVTPSTQTASPLPAYQPQESASGYVPHVTYPYSDSYGPRPGYEGYLVPAVGTQYSQPHANYMSSIVPSAQSALQVTLKVLAKVGLFLLGGMALLIVGGIFTTAVCSLTPLCTITFHGFDKINKDTMRAYMTPEGMATAAAFVEDAVSKYQTLQRTVNGK